MIELSNPEDYADFIHNHPVTLIHFWGVWNAYDHLMKERLKGLESEYENIVEFGSVNVDREEMIDICIEVGMKNVPALAYYENGSRIETIIGLESKEKIKERLQIILLGNNQYEHT